MMNGEKITVVVPVYNVETYVGECLESIIHQTYQNIEIILVNDGSTDGSKAILDAYAQKDERIIVIDKVNGGLSDARNEGLKHATGKYVCFIDSDDVIDQTYVEALYQGIVDHHADISVCDMEYFYDDGTRKFSDGGQFTTSSVKDNPSLILMNNSACNKLFLTSLFTDINFPVGKWYEDLATVPILLYKASAVTKVNAPLYFYRQRSGSIAHSADLRIFDIYDAITRVINYVSEHGNEEKIRKSVEQMYYIHGLDLTTLRIKDFDDKSIRVEFLKKNIEKLKQHYPDYKKDENYQKASLKKKLIYWLLAHGRYQEVLRIYDK